MEESPTEPRRKRLRPESWVSPDSAVHKSAPWPHNYHPNITSHDIADCGNRLARENTPWHETVENNGVQVTDQPNLEHFIAVQSYNSSMDY